MKTVQEKVEALFDESFSGLFYELRNWEPRAVEGESVVLEKIETLQSHIDLQALDILDGKLDKVTKSSRATLAWLSNLQSKDYPFSSLVVVRSATAAVDRKNKRTLRSRFVATDGRAKKCDYLSCVRSITVRYRAV